MSLELVDTDTKKPLTLVSLEVSVTVQSFLAKTAVTLVFLNETNRTLEGELLFPLPEGGYVCGYALDIDGTLINGVVVSKEDSRVAFETTGGENSCGMIEQAVGNIYKTRVYPFKPKGTRTLRIIFCEEVKINFGREKILSWKFPSTIPQTTLNTFSFEVSVMSQFLQQKPVLTINSPVPKELSSQTLRLDKERSMFYLHYTASLPISFGGELPALQMRSMENLFVLEPAKEGYYFALADKVSSVPSQQTSVTNKQLYISIFWDASFSQRTNRTGNQLYFHLLLKLARSLPNAIFDITQFRNVMGPTHQFDSVGSDLDWVDHLRAVFYDAGTDFSQINFSNQGRFRDDYHYSFHVLLSNGVTTLSTQSAENFGCPVHVFSEESSANHDFLKKIAKKSGGSYTNMENQQASAVSIDSILNSLSKSDILLREVRCTPDLLSKVVPGSKNLKVETAHYTTVCGFISALPDASKGIPKMTLSYQLNDGSVKDIEVDIVSSNLRKTENQKIIQTFWAKKRLKEIQEDENVEQKMEELLFLSKKFRLLTPYTSMLVLGELEAYLQHDVKPPKELPEMRKDFLEIIEGQKMLMRKKKEGKINGILSLWESRKQWWQGLNAPKQHLHFLDYSQKHLFQSFNDLDQEFLFEEFEKHKNDLLTPVPQPQCTIKSTVVEAPVLLDFNFETFAPHTNEPAPQLPTPSPQMELSEEEPEEEQEQEQGPPQEFPIQANTVRKGTTIVIDGKLFRVSDVSSSKTGKHGSAKVMIMATDADGNKVEKLMNSSSVITSANVTMPSVPKNVQKKADAQTKAAAPVKKIEKDMPKWEKRELREEASKSVASSAPSQPTSVSGTSLKKGDSVVIDGKQIRLLEVTRSKTGKHGGAKMHIVAVDADGKKVEQIMSSSAVFQLTNQVMAQAQTQKAKHVQLPTNFSPIDDDMYVLDSFEAGTRTQFRQQANDKLIFTHSHSFQVELYQQKVNSDWMKHFQEHYKNVTNCVPFDWYLSYIQTRRTYGHLVAFYFDIACFFFEMEAWVIGYRILSTISELDIENPHNLRIVARKLSEYPNFFKTFIQIFETILSMRPEEPVSYLDLCMSLQKHPEWHQGTFAERSLKLLNKVIKGVWPKIKFLRYNQVEVIILSEMNRITSQVQQWNLQDKMIDQSFIDYRLVALNLPVDIRVLLYWHDDVDIELHVTDPNNERCYSFHNSTKAGGLLSADTTGFGPEEYVIRDALQGEYLLFAKIFHTTRNNPTGSIVTGIVYTNFGKHDQTCNQISFRLCDSKECFQFGKIMVRQ